VPGRGQCQFQSLSWVLDGVNSLEGAVKIRREIKSFLNEHWIFFKDQVAVSKRTLLNLLDCELEFAPVENWGIAETILAIGTKRTVRIVVLRTATNRTEGHHVFLPDAEHTVFLAYNPSSRHYYPLFQTPPPTQHVPGCVITDTHSGAPEAGSLDEEPSDGEEEEELPSGELEVDFIANKRPRGRGFQYLVKWNGFPLDQSTWEAASMLDNCGDKIRDYEEAESQAAATVNTTQCAQPREQRQTQLPARELPARAATARTSDDTVTTDVGKGTDEVLRSYQHKLVAVLLQNFDERLPLPEVIKQMSKCLDFTKMPLCASATDEDPLIIYGESALTWLVQNKLPHLDLHEVLIGYLRIKLYVREHRDRFMADIEKKDEKSKKTIIVGRQLDLGLIYETLFTEHVLSTGEPPKLFLQVAKQRVSNNQPHQRLHQQIYQISSHQRLHQQLDQISSHRLHQQLCQTPSHQQLDQICSHHHTNN